MEIKDWFLEKSRTCSCRLCKWFLLYCSHALIFSYQVCNSFQTPSLCTWSCGFPTRQTGSECVPGTYWTNKPANNKNGFYSLMLFCLMVQKANWIKHLLFFFILIFLLLPFVFSALQYWELSIVYSFPE